MIEGIVLDEQEQYGDQLAAAAEPYIQDHPDPASNQEFVRMQIPSIEITDEEYEPGMRYSLDASMSPEGRREYGV